jgi:hypothetical protein
MRRLLCALAFVPICLCAAPLEAATVGLAWDANVTPPAGYRILYGTVAGQEATVVDVGNVTTATITGLTSGTAYFFVAKAYDAAGNVSGPSNEVTTTPVDPVNDCLPPLGTLAIAIFPTGRLNKTGSGGGGSKAFISFQTASPNSPVVYTSIRANGVDIADSVTQGSNLHAIGSLWFTLPTVANTYSFSVYARNAAGCERDQSTGFSAKLP